MKKEDCHIGDKVKWDGGADPYRPRWYYGEVLELKEGYAIIIDNEWYARSGVTYMKLQKEDA